MVYQADLLTFWMAETLKWLILTFCVKDSPARKKGVGDLEMNITDFLRDGDVSGILNIILIF